MQSKRGFWQEKDDSRCGIKYNLEQMTVKFYVTSCSVALTSIGSKQLIACLKTTIITVLCAIRTLGINLDKKFAEVRQKLQQQKQFFEHFKKFLIQINLQATIGGITLFVTPVQGFLTTSSHVLFCQKQSRKICNKSSNCGHMCLTITKITMGLLSKFNCERPFIVKHNWKICCGFLIVYGLVFRNLGYRASVHFEMATLLTDDGQ